MRRGKKRTQPLFRGGNMDGNINRVTSSICSFIRRVGNSVDRTIHKIGYIRAAAELDRLGYTLESKKIREELIKYK